MTTERRWIPAFVGVVTLLLAGLLAAQQNYERHPSQAANSKIGVLHVKANVYLLYGAGANIAMQVGDQAVVLVDCGPAELSGEIRAAIRTVSNRPIGYIINTSADRDHTGGNENLARGGFFMLESANLSRPQASVVAHLSVLERMTAKNSGVASGSWPTDTYNSPDWKLYANDEPLIVEHIAAAHSDGDSIVFFRRSDVVSTGDIFDMTRYPVIEGGGSLQGILDGLNHILQDIAVAKDNEQGGTMIIPGHGRVCDRNDLANYRDMLTIIHDRIRDLVTKGMTLEQVQAAKPTYDYDGGYGVENGPWTTTMFVEEVYRELSKKGK